VKVECREKNIFYNIIKNETSLTEVFCNLMQYKAFRDLFLNFVQVKTKNLTFDFNQVMYSDFVTEKEFKFYEEQSKEDKKIGRGDLILNIDGLEYIFELKIETTTSTTENQPDGYLKYLREQDNNDYKKRLFFILPKGYKHKNALEQAEQINILYWEDFLEVIKTSELHKLNIFINEFYNIVYDNWFYFNKLSFNKIELNYIYSKEKLQMENKAIPTIMMQVLAIVNELQASYKSNWSKNGAEYVFGIKNSNSEVIFWFGIDYKLWEEKGYPLAIGFAKDENNKYFSKFKKQFSTIKIDYKEDDVIYYYLPIKMDILKSNTTLEIKKIIDNVIDKTEIIL